MSKGMLVHFVLGYEFSRWIHTPFFSCWYFATMIVIACVLTLLSSQNSSNPSSADSSNTIKDKVLLLISDVIRVVESYVFIFTFHILYLLDTCQNAKMQNVLSCFTRGNFNHAYNTYTLFTYVFCVSFMHWCLLRFLWLYQYTRCLYNGY